MNIQLSDHFNYKKLFLFTLPSVVMMVFTSVYCVVDGFFVSNFAGKTAFAAINLIMPFIMILGGIGFMIGTGGSALVSYTLGTGDKEKLTDTSPCWCTSQSWQVYFSQYLVLSSSVQLQSCSVLMRA